MATAGPRYPGTVTTASVATESANDWLTPTGIQTDNASEAQITAATYDSPDISFRLIGANFGFSADIPADSTINGITVEIDRRSIIANSGKDFRVQLQDAAAALVGTNKADTVTVWPTTSTIATYGGAADTWTASPTAAMVNDPDFGVVLSVSANIANADIGVDFIRVTIDYTPPAPSGTGAISVPSATVSGSGELTLTATGAISVPSATVAGTGAETFTATGAITGQAPTVAGSGTHTEGGGPEPVTGTGAITVPAATVAGTGSLGLTGTGAIIGRPPTVVGSGTETITGTGAIVAPSATVSGSGTGGADDPPPDDDFLSHLGRAMWRRLQMEAVRHERDKKPGKKKRDEIDELWAQPSGQALLAAIALLL